MASNAENVSIWWRHHADNALGTHDLDTRYNICVHFCSEWSIVGYETGAFWDLGLGPFEEMGYYGVFAWKFVDQTPNTYCFQVTNLTQLNYLTWQRNRSAGSSPANTSIWQCADLSTVLADKDLLWCVYNLNVCIHMLVYVCRNKRVFICMDCNSFTSHRNLIVYCPRSVHTVHMLLRFNLVWYM